MKFSSTLWSTLYLAVGAFAAAIAMGASASVALAQKYPTKPITIVVPFAPGAADVFIRAIAPALEAELGQPIIIENRPGANGTVAANSVQRAVPDGYTLLMAPSSILATRFVIKDTNFDVCKDFAAVSSIHESPMLLATHPGLGVKSVKELIEKAKAEPGKITFGSAGAGSVMHLNAEVFQNASDIDLSHITYKGAALFIPDLISGRIDLAFSTAASLIPQVSDQKLVALAVLDDKPLAWMPGVPAMKETLPDFRKVSAFTTIVAPREVPESVRAKVHQAVEKVLGLAETKTIFEKNRGLVFSTKSPDELQEIICSESELLDKLTKRIGIQPK